MTPLIIWWLMQQGAEPPFLPQTAEGILSVVGRIIAGAIIAIGFAWRIVVNKVRHVDQRIDKSCATLRQEREAMRVEIKRDIQDEVDDRKNAVKALYDRELEMRQNVHNLMGEVRLMREEVHADRLGRVREMSEMRLYIEQGFNEVREAVREAIHECSVRNSHSRRDE